MNAIQPYHYHVFPGEVYAYGFVTDSEIEYQITFRSVPFLFSDIPELAELVFELSIIPVSTSVNPKPAADDRIYLTVIEILKEFFLHLPDNVTLYLSDSSDNRHRLFSSWFNLFKNKDEYIKIEVALNEKQPDDIAFTVLMQKDNACINRILKSIEQLKKDFRQGG